MIGAILFDVDGTLIDSNDLHAAAWQQALGAFGVDLSFDKIRQQIGKGGDNLLPALLPADLVKEKGDAIEDFRSDLFGREFLPRVTPFPCVRTLFETLYAADIKIVLATSARQEELSYHRGLLGCEDLIYAATSSDDVSHSKPCPDIFQSALGKVAPLGPGEVWVIGDTPWDMKAARNAGMKALAVRCGGFPESQLREAGAEGVHNDPAELAATFPTWLQA